MIQRGAVGYMTQVSFNCGSSFIPLARFTCGGVTHEEIEDLMREVEALMREIDIIMQPQCDCGGEKCKLPCMHWCSTRLSKKEQS